MSDRSEQEVHIPLHREDNPVPDTPQNERDHAAASDPTAPINTEKPLSERIAELKARQQEGESGAGSSPTSGQSESSNTSTTASSATRDASDPQRSAGSQGESGDAGTLTSREPAPGTARSETTIGDGNDARVADGTKSGERVRETSTSIVPESNDVMLGDQSSRKDGPKEVPSAPELKADGSKSPHDSTSDGSRQEMAHQQILDAQRKKDEDDTPPAFRAEAKTRTI